MRVGAGADMAFDASGAGIAPCGGDCWAGTGSAFGAAVLVDGAASGAVSITGAVVWAKTETDMVMISSDAAPNRATLKYRRLIPHPFPTAKLIRRTILLRRIERGESEVEKRMTGLPVI